MKFRINGRQPIPVSDDAVDGLSIEATEAKTNWSIKSLMVLYDAVFGETNDNSASEAIEKVLGAWRDDPEKVIIRNSEFAEIKDADLAVFLVMCSQRGVDPWRGQAYPIFKWDNKRGNRIALGVPIETQRAIADLTGVYAGVDDPIHEYDESGALRRTVVNVYKFVCGQRVKFAADAHYLDYYPDAAGTVAGQHSRASNAVRAEAQALRRAFPVPLSKMYAPEEFPGARPNDRIPSDPAIAEAAEGERNFEHSSQSFHTALMDMGICKLPERAAVVDSFRGIHPGMLERDAAGFYSMVLGAVRRDPGKWRAAAVG